jgi:inosine-uridine nucleoside N-ribohydrolase
MGSDIDDSLALTYLLAQPLCELLGVITVSGEPEKRASVADSLIRYFGRRIPVFPGVEQPLLTPQQQPFCPQAEILARWAHASSFRKNYALEFIRDMSDQFPGEVTLLSIGPATNAALALASYPELAAKLAGVTQMIGYFTNNLGLNFYSEWNCFCDPFAAALVYQRQLHRHRSVGLDVTMKTSLPQETVNELFKIPALKPVFDYSRSWFAQKKANGDNEGMYFHDAMAAVSLFDESLFEFIRGEVSVELISGAYLGGTQFEESEEGPHEIAVEVDLNNFYDHFFGVLGSAM